NIKELLRAEVRTKAGLGDHDVGKGERGTRRKDAVATVRDVAERPGVDERRSALERLNEIGTNGVLEKESHRARRVELARRDRTPRRPGRRADDDPPEPRLEILRARGQRHDRHDLAGRNDHEVLFARDAVANAAKADDAVPE